jgi:dolichol-phosphate mannosyltransferase
MQATISIKRDTNTPKPLSMRALVAAPTGDLRVGARPAQSIWPVSLSLIIPTYNEAKNLRELVRCLTAALDGPLGTAYELIVVDDDSPDETWALAQDLTTDYPRLRVMRRRGERGLSTAVLRGFQVARGDVLAVIDADLQHPPEVVVELWEKISRGADLAVASRNVEGGGVSDWSLRRRALSRGAQLVGLAMLPSVVGRVSDPMSGYFMVRRDAIAERALSPLGYKILIEILGRGELKHIAEVGYVFRERSLGESKVSAKVYVDYLRHLARLRVDTLSISRFARFATVGASGVAVDMLLLYAFSDPNMLGWSLTLSKVVAAEFAILNNFLWNDAWTFVTAAGVAPRTDRRLNRFLSFNVICGMGICLNVILLNVLYGFFGVNRYLANAIAIAMVTLWNYRLNERLTYGSSSTPRRLPASVHVAAASSSRLGQGPRIS